MKSRKIVKKIKGKYKKIIEKIKAKYSENKVRTAKSIWRKQKNYRATSPLGKVSFPDGEVAEKFTFSGEFY